MFDWYIVHSSPVLLHPLSIPIKKDQMLNLRRK